MYFFLLHVIFFSLETGETKKINTKINFEKRNNK